MKLEIPPTKLLIAVFACTLSIVSTTDYSIFDGTDRSARNAAALPKSEFRRYVDVPETLHVLRRSARQDTNNIRVKHRHDRSVVINVTGVQPDSFDFEHPPEYGQIVQKFYLTNLHTADRLAENTVSIFGLILESPNSGLTFEQYSSLEIIHNAIKRRQFHMYRLLQVLNYLRNQPCVSQFYLIMRALSEKLPPYLACAANFLVSQISHQLFDVYSLLTVVEKLNFLTGISEDEIAFGGLYVKAMEQNSYDDASRIDEAIVGPFFVHIFALMSDHSLIVSQPLFASILLNLPNHDGDPIFNEYVRFVVKIAWEGKIPNWSAKSYKPTIGHDINFLIETMVLTICQDPDVSYDIKQALWYIRNHFERSVKHTVPQPADEAYRATKDGIHIHQLFAVITPQEFSPHANRLKAQLIEYIDSHEFVIQKALAGMNWYGYTSPKHLLLAFLTRLRTRLPAEEVEIRKSVSALLSILMLKRQAWNFFGLHEGDITLWTLLDTLNDSETNPKMAKLVQTILNELLGKVGLWRDISNMKLNNINKCDTAEGCLREMLQILVEQPPPDSLSPETYIATKKLINMIAVEIDRLSIPVVPNEPSVCDCVSTRQPHTTITSEPPSEEPTIHNHTTTVRPSIPATSEAPSEEPTIHEHTTTVRPSIPSSSKQPSEEPTIHGHTATVTPSISGTSEAPSEEPTIHEHTTTVRPSIPSSSKQPSEEPTIHGHTATVTPSISGTSEAPSEVPTIHEHTTTVRPSIPSSSKQPSEEPTIHGHTTTVTPSISGSSEAPSEEPTIHEHTTTVRPSIPSSSKQPSEEPTIHGHTATVTPSISGTSEAPSEEPTIHEHTTTVRPSIPSSSKQPSEEPTIHGHTATVTPSISGTSEAPSEVPTIHEHTTTVRPSIPSSSKQPSEEPTIHGHTTTVTPSISGSSEAPSEEPTIHDHTTTVRPSIPASSKPPSEGPTIHDHTTTVTPSISGSSEAPSEEPTIHAHTTTVRPSIPASSKPPSEEPTIHDHTTTARPSIPGTSEVLSEEPTIHDHTTTVRPSIPASSKPISEEPTIHDHTTTVTPSIPATSEAPSEEPEIYEHTPWLRPSIPIKAQHRNDTTTVRPTILANAGTSTEPTEHRPRKNQTTEYPSTYYVSDSIEPLHHTTTLRPLINATDEIISEGPTVHPYITTVTPSTKVVDITTILPIKLNNTYKPDTAVPIRPLPLSVNPEESMHVFVPHAGVTSIETVRIDENSSSSDTVTIPSILCLEETPSADKLKGTCEKDLIPITQILTRVFAEDYIQVLLGDGWEVRYPTRISFVAALLEKAQKSDQLSKHDLLIVTRYIVAFRFVSSYVLLPLIAGSQNLNTEIVWLTYNPENPSECHITSERPHELGENVLTLPLVNPTSWLLPVDTAHPFVNLLPQLPPDDPYAIKIQPLTELFNSGNIREYLGKDWNPSQYTNRGAAFTSVLHILLKLESVQSNPQLYDVVRSYLITIERLTQYIHISDTYIDYVIREYQKQTKIYVTTRPLTGVPGEDASIKMLSNFLTSPLKPILPLFVYPGLSIHVNVSYAGILSLESPNNPASPDVVMLPSFDCLLNKPRPEDNPESRCQRDLIPISQPLSHIFGANYIREILGNNWEILYPTRISLLVALLTAAEQNPKCQTDTELIAVINRYKAACEFVPSYVLLPLVVDSHNLTAVTVWSTFDLAYRWRSTIGSHEVDGFGPDAVTLPLANPKLWWTLVDNKHPFAFLVPYLPKNDPRSIKLQPLFSLLESGKITDLLGSSWKSSDYLDTGSLFVSVLRRLLTLEIVTTNGELYSLVCNYLMALELPALYVHVPQSYVQTIFNRYGIPWMEETYTESIRIPNNIPLPPLINPSKILQVIVPESGAPVIESVRSKKLKSKKATILPSVNCLQGASTADHDEDAGDTCDSVLEFRLTEPLIEVFGDDYVEKILGEDWDSLYPTRISFLAGLLRNAVKNKIVLENPNQLHQKVTSFKEALEVAAPYIFLPMLANYQKLVTPNVWLTYNYYKPWESHMGRNPPQRQDNSTVTLPLVNPKIWYLPVNRHHPFSGFLPNFPTTNPYEEIIAPLRSVLTVEYLQNLTGSAWDPSQYPNRGVFFVSAMHKLLKFGSTRMNSELYSLVRSYYMAIEIPSLYIHIPRSYISNAIETASGAWNVDLDGLMVALMEAITVEEREYQRLVAIFLKRENLLKELAIVLPSSTTTKHVFLLTIIKAALSSTTIQLRTDTILALRACQARILTTGAGAEVVGWVWVSTIKRKILIDVTKIVTKVIPIERIPEENRGAYQDLLEFFSDYQHIQVTEDFHAYRYHTYGAFLRGYLNHLVYKSRVSNEVREKIELVIPYIRYTGPGAAPVSYLKVDQSQ